MAGLIKRGSTYYAVYYVAKKQKRVSLETESLQVAKEKLRHLESSLYRGDAHHFPTKTPIGDVVADYVEHMKTRKTAKSVERDISYLREAFGPVCPALALKNAKNSERKKGVAGRGEPVCLEATCFEALTTADIATFIAAQVRRKGLAPKTANRYREILTRLYNWGIKQNGIKLPGDKNPAAQVERYREHAPVISFLTLPQIGEQLAALELYPDLKLIVALYIYAGIRREELCWLRVEDIDLKAETNGMIRVRAKSIGEEFWEPKTKVNRVVPISRILRTYLDTYAVPGSGWYFRTPTGKRWDPDNLSGALRAANVKAGLAWTCLDFRHTFGSQLAMKGESLYKIATLMGNSPEICRRHYAALLPESLVGSVEFGDMTPTAPPPVAPGPPTLPTVSLVGQPRLRLIVSNG